MNNTSAPIIEDWNSDDESEIDYTVRPITEKIKSGNQQQKEYKEKAVIDCGIISGKGKIKTGSLDFDDVYFCKELKYNLFSVSQICDKKNNVLFTDTECLVLSSNFKLLDESQVLLRVPRKDNIYSVDLKSVVPTGGLTCLIAKATIDESNTWHRRLGHINFKTMNKLVKGNLVKGLPSKIFENDHSCVACQKGKQHKASYKTKLVNSISKPLHMLHMDLFGPTNVKSLMKKSYCLVVTDDFSRFSWVFFLATKDETSGILKTFITEIENQLDHKVKVIRSDNGTEFKNSIMNQFCEMKGIKREFSVARTPQQNGVAERKNRTLIEAARTMLVDSKLPTTFWAEAVNTACYVLNRVLVIKPHNKTPYELIRGRPPLIDFMKPFGCPVTILNTRDHLGKFDGKADEGYFVGYSVVSKAMRVFNKRTRIVEETLNIRFLENIPNVKGNGPDWLFDVDSLSISMNYAVRNKTNDIVGTKDNIVAGQAQKEKEPEQEYILIPLCITDPLISQGPKDCEGDAGIKHTKVDENEASNKSGKHDQEARSESERLNQREIQTEHTNSSNGINTVSKPVSTAGPSFDTAIPSTPVNTAGPSVSIVNEYEEQLFERFSPFKNAFTFHFQPNGSQLVYEDLEQIHEDDIEEMDLKWQLALLSIRTRRFFQKNGRKITINGSDTAGYDKSKLECFNGHKIGHFAREYRGPRNQDSRNRNQDSSRRTVNVEETSSKAMMAIDGAEQLVFYKKNEVIFYEQLAVLKRDISYKDSEISMLKNELEKLKQEKESNQLKIENFDNASKSLDKLIGSQIPDKSRKGVGFVSYNAVPPPPTGLFSPPKFDLSNSGLEEFQQPEFEGYRPKTSKSVSEDISNEVRESPDAPLVKELVSDDKLEKKTIFPTVAKIEFVRPKQQEKPVRKPAHCNYHQRERVVSGNNYTRVNYNYSAKKAHPSAHRNMVPRLVLMKTGLRSLNTARTINTGHPRKEDQCYVDSGCSRHMTGNMLYLSDFKEFDGGYVTFKGGAKGGEITSKGTLKTGKIDFEDVYFVKELQFNLFSISQMRDKKNSVLFTDIGCFVLSPDFKLADESQILLKVSRKNNMYSVDMKNIVPKECLTCLVAKATLDESMLWHRRLGHVNFKTISKLVKENLVRGLPSKHFENDQTRVACLKGKQHKTSCKSKIQNSITQPLFMLHIDLFGLTFVSSLMNKKYCLVITDDYSRFTWVFFLATKDETSGMLKRFITEIENLVDKKVNIIRCENETEFKNRVMSKFCKEKGIKKEFSATRTPQQNGVAERRNRTLIEAARTMLDNSKLPTIFGAEVVNTACYVQNKLLVVKPHNKTPYELFRSKTPALSFMRLFGCHVTILNTLDYLGKFDGKSDVGFFVGYSMNSKAFR
ncbi:putative ribonuclease H-like domain-containing protein, partial [Tanacetum coccineum]